MQGVLLTFNEPSIVVRAAIKEAGFDPTKNWIIVLRVRDQAKREKGLDEVIDYEILLAPGLTFRQAGDQVADLLRTHETQIIMFSQFSYDSSTGRVDTRVRR